jgi:hypothetical protein
MHIYVEVSGEKEKILVKYSPNSTTQKDIENQLAKEPHCYLMDLFEFYTSDEKPIIYGRLLSEFGVVKGCTIIAKNYFSRSPPCSNMNMRQDYLFMQKPATWLNDEFEHRESIVPPHNYFRTGINLLCDCDNCGTKNVFVQVGLKTREENFDAIHYQFTNDFKCPVNGCDKTPTFKEFIFMGSSNYPAKITIHGNFMQNGIFRTIDTDCATSSICMHNKWCKINCDIRNVNWIKLFVSCIIMTTS